MSLRGMTSMERSDDEKEKLDDVPMPSLPDVPWGLQIRLTGPELDKLGLELDDDVKLDDIFHIRAMARVTAIDKHSRSGNPDDSECVELSIIALGLENESTEDDDEDDDKGKGK